MLLNSHWIYTPRAHCEDANPFMSVMYTPFGKAINHYFHQPSETGVAYYLFMIYANIYVRFVRVESVWRWCMEFSMQRRKEHGVNVNWPARRRYKLVHMLLGKIKYFFYIFHTHIHMYIHMWSYDFSCHNFSFFPQQSGQAQRNAFSTFKWNACVSFTFCAFKWKL